MKKSAFPKYLVYVLIIFSGRNALPQDSITHQWPRFRGENGSGIASVNQVPPIILDTLNNLIWKSPLVSGASSPCIWENNIFLTGFNKESSQLMLMSINRLNGKLNWRRIIPATRIEPYHRSASPADATPVTDDQQVYIHFGSFGLLAYDFEGNLKWTYELPVNSDKFGSGSSPVLAGHLVIQLVRRLDSNERYLLAIDKHTGSRIWRTDLLEAGYSTPVIWNNDIVIHCEGFVAGYRIKDGTESWMLLSRTHGESSPTVINDTLYINTWHFLGDLNYPGQVPTVNEFLNDYDLNHDAMITREEFPENLFPSEPSSEKSDNNRTHSQVWSWFETDKNDLMDSLELKRYLNFCTAGNPGVIALKHGAGSMPQLLWRETENVAEVPSPLYFKARIYVIKNGGFISCIKSASGELVHKSRIKGMGAVFTSPIAAGDQVYIASHNGKVVTLATGDDIKILSVTDFGDKILATPAIVDDKVYLRTEKFLYVFGD